MLFGSAARPFAICPGRLGAQLPVIPCLSVQIRTVWGSAVPTPAELSLQMKSCLCSIALLCNARAGFGSLSCVLFCLCRDQFRNLAREWLLVSKTKQANKTI